MKLGLFPTNLNINFMKRSTMFLSISVVFILLSFFVPIFNGLNTGVDFKGGVVIDLQAPENYDLSNLRDTFASLGLFDTTIKEFNDDKLQVLISSSNFPEISKVTNTIDDIKSSLQSNYIFLQSQFVGPTISSELIKGAIYALVGAFAGIFIYLWARFNWQYSIIGLATLIHDVAITLLFLSIFQFEISISTIAGLLTIIGYSINDTVVVFDQIRENVKKYVKESNNAIINRSINQVLSRSIATLVTVLLVLIPIFILAEESLKSFSFTLIIGIIVGGYSSICLSAPMLSKIGNIKAKIIKKNNE